MSQNEADVPVSPGLLLLNAREERDLETRFADRIQHCRQLLTKCNLHRSVYCNVMLSVRRVVRFCNKCTEMKPCLKFISRIISCKLL